MQLDPVQCPACGARVALDGTASPACHHCHTRVELAPAYVEAARDLVRRIELRQQLEPLWAALSKPPTWHWILAAAVAVLLLPPIAMAVQVWVDAVPRAFLERFGLAALPALLPGGLVGVLVGIRVATAIGTSEAMAAVAPERAGDPPGCRGCGSPLHVAPDAVAATCGYCGVDSVLAGVTLGDRARHLRADVNEKLRTLQDAIARIRVRRRLSMLGVTLVFAPLAALGWLIGWASGAL